MFSSKTVLQLQKINSQLPARGSIKPAAEICRHCFFINENDFSFCTNCGYPLKNNLLTEVYNNRVQQRTQLLFKAENSVSIARIILYVMASFLATGIFFIFAESSLKYFIVMLAALLSGLFFFLAFWSRRNPFSALLTSFIILVVFSAINIFGTLVQSFTTVEGMTGMLICIAALLVVLRGVQGAYKINLIRQELHVNY